MGIFCLCWAKHQDAFLSAGCDTLTAEIRHLERPRGVASPGSPDPASDFGRLLEPVGSLDGPSAMRAISAGLGFVSIIITLSLLRLVGCVP